MRKIFQGMGCGFLLLISAKGKALGTGGIFAANVFGHDDRILLNERSLPNHLARAIGRLTVGRQHCTASLVGPDRILTAAHCLKLPTDTEINWDALSFKPSFSADEGLSSVGISSGVYGTMDTNQRRAADWAILKLKEPIGLRLGWFEVMSLHVDEALRLGPTLTLIGYSSDFGNYGQLPSFHAGCSVRASRERGIWDHDCDMAPGASGGPLLARWERRDPGGRKTALFQIIGINVAQLETPEARAARQGTQSIPIERRFLVPDYRAENANFVVPAYQFFDSLFEE